MNKLLIIAYYFPPSGGPGVQRVLKHVQYLPEFGWQPVVLTVSNGQFPARDESLIDHIPSDCIVKRSYIPEPYDLYRKLTRRNKGEAIDVNTINKEGHSSGFKDKIAELIRATFFIPDARIGWYFTAKKAIKEIMAEHDIKAVYSSSPPYTCSLIAKYTKKKYRLPWVAGFRDPWTDFISSPKRWFLPKAIDRHMEFSVFDRADSVECAWQGIINDALTKYPELDAGKFHHVPNGFDSNDFPDTNYVHNEKFTLTYTGSLYGRRNPASLFEAIEKLVSDGKIEPNEFRLRFVGRFGDDVKQMFEKASFSDSIETVDYVPHEESIKFLLKSDSLLLIVDESKESNEIVPGKVYEYIGVKRPIIAIAPQQSAISKLIRETRSGRIAHQSEIEQTANIFLTYFMNWKNKEYSFSPDDQKISKYERKESARQLAILLNSKLA